MATNTPQHLIHEALKSWLDSLVEYLSLLDALTQPNRPDTDEEMLPKYIAFRDDLALLVSGFIEQRDVATVDWPGFGAAVSKCFEANHVAVLASTLTDSEALTTFNECHPRHVTETLEGRGIHVKLAEQLATPVEPSTSEDGPF